MVNTKYSRVGRIPWTDTTILENLSSCEHAYNIFALKNTPRDMVNYPVPKKKIIAKINSYNQV